MFDNTVLDITTGLVLMFLVLSLMVTVINEFISTWLNVRANTLKDAIEGLLDDQGLRDAFYNYGLVAGLHEVVGDHPSYLSGQTFASTVIGSLSNNPIPTIDDVKAALNDMADSNIRDALLTQVTKAGDDLDKLRNEIANYFDSSMDRVTGIYKRYMKLITLVVGFAIVVVLNADTIKVGTALWKDASLRAQMTASSQALLASGAPSGSPAKISVTELSKKFTQLQKDLRPLPIGWNADQWKYVSAKYGNGSWTLGAALWLLIVKLIGLAITAFAISLGAPFWFDTLSKFMNVRGAGNKPATTDISEVRQPPAATLTITTQGPAVNAGGSPGKP